jgi:hypothetical protein
MTSPQARSSARDDKKEKAVVRKGRLLEERAKVQREWLLNRGVFQI